MSKVIPVLHCPDPAAWIVRLDCHIEPDAATGCHIWSGRCDPRTNLGRGRGGYGKFRFTEDGKERMTGAHRAAWLARVGDIPAGMQIDHLCHRPPCVNVEHLDLVMPAENVRRAVVDGLGVGRPRGSAGMGQCGTHQRENGFLYTRKDGYVRWVCRTCTKAAMVRYQERQRQLIES